VFTARYGLNLRVMYIKPLKPSGHYMYRQFNIQQFYILPPQCIYVFCVDLRKKKTASVFCAVRTERRLWVVFRKSRAMQLCVNAC
jgi:hypothetical protein